MTGRALVRASWAGTAAFAATAAAAVLTPAAGLVAVVVSLALFAAGAVAFAVALVVAAGRSRTSQLSVLALFLIDAGAAPRSVRRQLLAALAAQLAVALAAATARPNTSLAFGVLVPLYGLGVAGLWGARHGAFPARAAGGGPPRR